MGQVCGDTGLSPVQRSSFAPTCGYFQYHHLALRRCTLSDEFSSVRRARSIPTIPEVLTKPHILVVVFIKLLTGSVQSSLPCTPRSSTRIDFSSEGLVMGSYSVHLQEESGLACRPLVQCP